MGGRKLPCQNQLDSFRRFDKTPICDRRTDRHRHGAIAITRAGKKTELVGVGRGELTELIPAASVDVHAAAASTSV